MHLIGIEVGPLRIENFKISPSETWCFLGGNGSGKTLLANVLCEEIQYTGKIEDAPTNPIAVSLESLQKDYEEELANDDSDFLDRIDYGSTGLEILSSSGASETEINERADQFHIRHLLHRGCRQFSSGELRKIYLLRELLKAPDLLVLDEPFEGLDKFSRIECSKLIESFIGSGGAVILFANRLEDISNWVSHLAVLQNGQIAISGEKTETLNDDVTKHLLQSHQTQSCLPDKLETNVPTFKGETLLNLQNGSVSYDGIFQFRGFDWELRQGEHTLITGPNGSGKSTLLNLISGDHPQCYVNDLTVFGYKRGSGESIWDIKRQLGLVSPAFHRDYRAGGSLETLVVSGFFDSIGLYEKPSSKQRSIARQWLALFGMEQLAGSWFRSLSFGQQRLGLIARALVKQPPLLILDEPTQGLDDANRQLVLAYIEKLASLQSTTLLFISHREDEHLSLFQHHLRFEPSFDKSELFQIFQS